MYNIEDIVINLDLSKQLLKLGVPSPSVFIYVQYPDWKIGMETKTWLPGERFLIKESDFSTEDAMNLPEIYHAYTFNELIRILPNEIHTDDTYYKHIVFNDGNLFEVYYQNKHGYCLNNYIKEASHEYPQETLCEYLIYLLHNKLITIEDLNK